MGEKRLDFLLLSSFAGGKEYDKKYDRLWPGKGNAK